MNKARCCLELVLGRYIRDGIWSERARTNGLALDGSQIFSVRKSTQRVLADLNLSGGVFVCCRNKLLDITLRFLHAQIKKINYLKIYSATSQERVAKII